MALNLLVGGAGFVGRNLVERLLNEGQTCLVVDNGSGLGPLRPFPPDVTLFEAEAETLEPADVGAVDCVYYLAAHVGDVSYNSTHQAEMLDANLNGLRGIRNCYSLRPNRFVYFSTACVYPSSAPVPTPEEWGNVGSPEPANYGYGLAKRVGEELVKLLWQETAIPTLIVRPFNLYGPWDLYDTLYGHFIAAVIAKMLRGITEIAIWGGDQTRSFTYVGDVVECVVRLTEVCRGLTTVNVGHDSEIKIIDAAALLQKATGYLGSLHIAVGPIGNPRRAADQTVLRNLVGNFNWTPLEIGLVRTIAWCREVGLDSLPSCASKL